MIGLDQRKLLEGKYSPYFNGLDKNSSEYEKLSKAATAYKNYFEEFRNYSNNHTNFILNNLSFNKVKINIISHCIDENDLDELTKSSLFLEGINCKGGKIRMDDNDSSLKFIQKHIVPNLYLSEDIHRYFHILKKCQF